MKVSAKAIHRILLQTKIHLFGNDPEQLYFEGEPPLRSKLFSSDQMKRHGKALSDSHKLSLKRPSEFLLTLLTENESVLMGARNLLREAIKANRRIVFTRTFVECAVKIFKKYDINQDISV